MHLNTNSISSLDRIKRLNLINSITGIKPANLIGTRSSSTHTNLAIISSVIHLGSDPALIGFIMRPSGEVRRDTYENIIETKYYTINHIHESFIEQAHYTSAKFDKEVSEFASCGLTEEYSEDFHAPFVKESTIKLGMGLVDTLPIKLNGTIMIIGEIKHIIAPDEIVSKTGYLNLEEAGDVGISGLNSYYGLKKLNDFPYVRVSEVPNFSKS